ncbi:hypothetical protein N658DRAFT_337026 [Parathielavia hyrcaniae]|uniref:Uncharacterized protein n=1 Tax=Parathielavia hyrcaniae TaxID=113614 RepID=A0AAN6Q3Z3_9PEZI|nr:hypothetical protein N658DRAFT_337026 [Parathielavia hyrcaniae]
MERPQMLTIARPIEYLLSGISSTSAIITRFIRSVRVAHSDLAAVTRDLSDLRLVLELLRDEPALPPALQAQMLLVLEGCGNVLIHIDTILARCSEAARWVGSGRGEISSCRGSLTIFREALALALEVASLSSSHDDTSNADSITAEVQRIQHLAQSTSQENSETEAALSSYFELVLSCTHRPRKSSSHHETEAGDTRTSPSESKGFVHGSGTHTPDDDTRASTARPPASAHAGLNRDPEPAVSWNPARNIALSYYTEEPASLSPSQEQRRSPQGLPESPTLPPVDGHPSPLPQRSLPLPFIKPAWKHSGSFSVRSEPPASPKQFHLESPLCSLDTIKDTKDDSFPHQTRVTSFASHGSGRSSSGSIPRASFTVTPVSAYHPDSMSPGLRRRGASSPGTLSPMPSSPPPEYSRTWINTPTSAGQFVVPVPAKCSPHQPPIDVSPKRHLTDKGKGSEILHIDTSPSSYYVATKHSNKFVKIWSIPKNALHGTIKITSYVQPRVRSREYFIRSHAILSENATLIGITSHFGLTLEIYNFSKGGSGAKKVQVIEEAHRWAASQRDAFHNDYAGLAVYRPKFERIDRYFLARHPGAKTPFREDPNHSIELLKTDLPFLPKFPELAYSSDAPILVAAAGPRPGDPPRSHATILIAWHMTPVSDIKLHSQTPEQPSSSLPDEQRHKPYRVCVPDYPALQTALPACLAAHGSTAVSVWIPASNPSEQHTSSATTSPLSPTSTTTTTTTTTTTRKTSSFSLTSSKSSPPYPNPKKSQTPAPLTPSAPDRLVLVWDLPTNTTKIFSIPPHAQACIAPDCRRLAYCDAASNAFVVVDVGSAAEVWRWPDAARRTGFASFGQLENLAGVTVFEFSADGRMLVVGDASGGVGVYQVGEGAAPAAYELGVGDEVAWVDVVDREIGRVRRG